MDEEQNSPIALLSSAYLGPVQYYSKMVSYPLVLIERFETYHKQSYRNRCIILSANGPQVLSIPVKGGPGTKSAMNELELSYDHKWQQIHWRSIVSAYKNSPFFDYCADGLEPFYHKQIWKYLIDFNNETQDAMIEALNFKPFVEYTRSYIKSGETPGRIDDFRYSIHPKHQRQGIDKIFHAIPYHQVFGEPFSFTPNLSIIDLLFNVGPGAADILRACAGK